MPLLVTDPIDLLLDPVTGDLDLSTGDVRFSSGLDGVVQAVRIRLLLIRGEWFLNLDAGIPYFERDGVGKAEAILGQKFDAARVKEIFEAEILETPGVLKIIALDVSFDNKTRQLSVNWQASTQFGDTPPDTLARGV